MSTRPVKWRSMNARYDSGWSGGRPMYSSSRNAVARSKRQRSGVVVGGPARCRRRAASCRSPSPALHSGFATRAVRSRRQRQLATASASGWITTSMIDLLHAPCIVAAGRTRRVRRRPSRRLGCSRRARRCRRGSRARGGRCRFAAASRAGVAEAAIDASASVHPVNAIRLRTASSKRSTLPASTPSGVRAP